jgi:hypothetical protein
MIDTWHFTLNILQPELSLHVIVDYDLHTVNNTFLLSLSYAYKTYWRAFPPGCLKNSIGGLTQIACTCILHTMEAQQQYLRSFGDVHVTMHQ